MAQTIRLDLLRDDVFLYNRQNVSRAGTNLRCPLRTLKIKRNERRTMWCSTSLHGHFGHQRVTMIFVFPPSGLGLANLRQKRSYMASHMVETDKELASSLLMTRKGQIDQTGQATGREADSKKQRKLARMQAIRQAQNNDTNKGPLSQSLLVGNTLPRY